MHVNINGRFLTQRITGVQRYAIELIRAIDVLIDRGEVNLTFSVISPKGTLSNKPTLQQIPLKQVGSTSGHVWEQFELPVFNNQGDMLINLCNTAPLAARSQVVTIHDASVFANAQTYPLVFRTWYNILLRTLGKASAKIITDSHFSKMELIRYCGIAPDKLHVVHLSGNHILDIQPDSSILEKHNIGDKSFVLAVSSVNPNKNFRAIVQALEILGEVDFDVVIVGGVNPRTFATSADSMPETVKYLGYISDNELRALYDAAALFVYPSFYEGFGLPPLEAMACGTPVITSNTSSLPEVVGDAGIMVNPHDANALAEAMIRVLNDSELSRNMKEKGLVRASMFSWEKTARLTLEVYQNIIA